MLYGRDAERSAISALLNGARDGQSGVLVLRGEPGIGKSSLLDAAVSEAGEMRVIRGAGYEAESELPFAGLHLLLASGLDGLAGIPGPQRAALEGAFGLGPQPPSDRLLVGLAVLSLLAELAEDGPMLCVVDDAQWLDRASAEALLLAARRLHAEGICLLMAARDGSFAAPGLPELAVNGLPDEAAQALLESGAPMDADVRQRVLNEARGNPLALIELPSALARERPGGEGSVPLTSRLQVAFHGQVSRLPAATRTLLLVAAAEETGELDVVLAAAAALGADVDALLPAEETGLVQQAGSSLAFRHPLVRAAVYQRAPLAQRLAAHRALGDALSGPQQADRRAWHRAASLAGPDEDVAAELEHSAARARERAGYAAAASAYERAARVSPGREAQTRRLTLAAEAAVGAGDVARAAALAERASRQADDPGQQARLMHVRALAQFMQGPFSTAHRLLLDGAELIAGSPAGAVRMLIQALHTGWYLGAEQLAESTERLLAIDVPAELAPLVDYLLGTLRTVLDMPLPEAGSPVEAVARARAGGAGPQELVQLVGATLILGDDSATYELARGLAAEAREQGSIGLLPTMLFFLAEAELFQGHHRDALATAAEGLRIAQDTGQRQWISQLSSFLAYLAALAGEAERCRELASEALADTGVGLAAGRPWAQWALGILDLGQGRAEDAVARLEELATGPQRYHVAAVRCIPDLLEAAVRLGDEPERVAEPFAHFKRWAEVVRRPWADALVLRCEGLLAPEPQAADERYAAALKPASRPFEKARTALLRGEALRRERHRTEARVHLQAALDAFAALGAAPWAERARTELTASGAPAEVAAPGPLATLTPQELQIIRLAAQGMSNREIAAQLFLSPRTIGYHLYKAYPKLGVQSRKDLAALTSQGLAALA
ncbi:AAA family ATPase [Actinomadura barringtoniae]|uniref:AAA family ATPase n=1 Tax=Actinomadura barringtoniae TaxID=1427535 RepID=A0A939PBU7_9ACTN|nr:helix-turn-helix transcriptional regulator [Actinomadura barringtoniae]MBO2446404.1 AAA family ATPase [Actinomadura barringtoniae]